MRKRDRVILSAAVSALLLFFAGPATAFEGWVPFNGASSAEQLVIEVPVSTMQEVLLDLDIPGMYVREIVQEGITYHGVSVRGSGYTTEVGKPQVPMIGRFVAIPSGATVMAEVVDSTFKVIEGYNIIPAQPTPPDVKDAPIPPFAIDEELYQRNEFYPSEIVQLEGPSIIRGSSVVILRVFPVQFNPVTKALRVYSTIRVKVSFEGGQGYFIENRLRSSPFNQMFRKLFLNGSIVTDRESIEAAYDDGNLLLIITHPDFLDAANTLADWKNEKGIYTVVVTTTETGSTVSAIQSYIQNAYDTWVPPPTYVLFIGDAEFIPCDYVTLHPDYPSANGHVGTDLYYATVDGTDYFPDISTGRLSVDTLTEAMKRVNDIIAYEKTPVTDTSFYGNIAVCAYFQDRYSPFNYADRRFAQTSEDLAIFFSDPSFLGDYSVDRIYYAWSTVTPQYWYNGTMHWNFGGGPAGSAGDPIPSYLLKPGFPWDGDDSDITTVVNAGRFLLTHRNHGDRWGWSEPYYHTTHVNALNNGDELPVVWSINCQTGWFDNETDDASTGTPSTEVNFSEAWERNANGGAVGIIASTRISYSGYNDRLCWGWTDAIWPGFEPFGYSPSGTPFDNPEFEMGPVLNYGKYYMATHYTESTKRKVEFEEFHWYGDPTMQIWTDVPQSLSVSHNATVPEGATSFDVTVGPNDGVVICISKDGEILGRSYHVGSGTYTITWSTPLVPGDEIVITVTGHNYRPYQGIASVTALLPDLVVLSIETDPVTPEPGEIVNVYVTVRNQGAGDANDAFYIDWYKDLAIKPSPDQVGDKYEYVSSLAAGATHTMTTNYTYDDIGSYNMFAQVDTDQDVNEKYEDNNVLGPKNILVGICEGDVNHDGQVDMQDWFLFGQDWGRTDCPILPPEKVKERAAANDNESGDSAERSAEGPPVYRRREVKKALPDGQQGVSITPSMRKGEQAPGGDIGDAREEPTGYAPIWERLSELDLSEKQNALLRFEVAEDLSAPVLDEVRYVETLWNSGKFAEAIEVLRSLEMAGIDIGVGISWKVPKKMVEAEWFAKDVRIGSRQDIKETHLDFDAETENLFAVLRYNVGSNYYWSVNISTNGGQTWQETYQWFASFEIKDTSAAVVDDYLFVGYVGTSSFDEARIRRCFVSDGTIDNGYGFQVVFDKDVAIEEIALATNADDWDNRVYYLAILSDYRLIYHWDDPNAVSWTEEATGVTDAWQGLDVSWNEGYYEGSGFWLHVSFIGSDAGGPVFVARHKGVVWEEIQVLANHTGLHKNTSASAYEDTVICMYEHQYPGGMGIRYNISYDGGDSWAAGWWEPPAGSNYYNPDVMARRGTGTACVHDDEAGAFDPVWYRHRDHYSPGPWSTLEQINEFDGATAWPNRIEWIPPYTGSPYGYGAIYISWDPDPGTPYFDRSDTAVLPCEGDLNNDGNVDMLDWFLFGGDWGRMDCPIALDCVSDQEQLIDNYGYWFEQTVVRWQEFFPEGYRICGVEIEINRTGDPGCDVLIAIEDASETTLWSITVPQASVPSGTSWVYAVVPDINVNPGESYKLKIWSSADTPDPANRYFWRSSNTDVYPGLSSVGTAADFTFRTHKK